MACKGPANRQRFSVYVLELGPGRYYVGSTAKSVTERVREHRRGGRKIRHRRTMGKWCVTRARAEQIERRTARRLRARGYRVRQG